MGLSLARLDPRESYGRKLAVALLVTTVLVGGVGVAIYITVDGQLTSDTEDQLQSSAASDATTIDNWARLTDRQLVAVTRSSAVRSGDTYRAQDQVARVSEREEIAGTYLVDRSNATATVRTGEAELTGDGDRLRDDVATRLQTLSDRSGQQVQYSVPFRLDGEGPVVLAVAKTPGSDDRVLVSVVDLATLSRELFGTGTDRAETVMVLNESGSVVLSNDRDRLLTDASAGEAAGDSGVFTQTDSGNTTAVGYASVGVHGWTATNQVPASEAYGLRETVSKQMLLLLAVLVVSLGAIGLTIGRNTVRSVTDLAERAAALRAGDLDASIETDRDDEFGEVYATLDSMRTSLRAEIQEAESAREEAEHERERAQAARAEAEQARQEAEQLNDRLEATATEFGSVMDACAEGDLSRRLPTDADSDAMVDVATAFNAMVEEWEATIREVRTFGTAVERESSTVARRVDEARATSETLADGMGHIAEEATDQASALQTVRDETEQLSASIEEASSSATEVATLADDLRANGEAGRDAAQAAMDDLDAIEARTEAAVQQVTQLETLVADVEAVTDLIADIAEQTNMLALNANIEAARADDSDGFGVVAGEIKQLVEETQEATADIEATIEELKTQTDATTAEMTDAQQKVADGAETIEAALAALEAIVDDVEETADGIAEIDRAIAAQAESTQAVMTELETVTDVSTETATAAENAAEDARSQADRMGTVTEGVDDLSTQARQLDDLLATFETGDALTDEQPALVGSDESPAEKSDPELAEGPTPAALPTAESVADDTKPATADGGTDNHVADGGTDSGLPDRE